MVNPREQLETLSGEHTTTLDVAWRAVVDATQGAYEVLAEIARDGDGAVAFVGRPLAGGALVALKLEPEATGPAGARHYTLFELKKLDDAVPAPRVNCPVCAALVTAWRGSCPACGSPIGAGADPAGAAVATDVLLAFYRFVSGRYDVVGEFALEGAGPPAYVVRERDAEGQYALLRLALGGTVTSGLATYVIDVLPLTRRGGEPGTPRRVPLDVAEPEALAASSTPTTAERLCPQCGASFGGGTLFCPRDGASLRPVTAGSDLIGQLIDDRYYIEQRLGQGGMGEVYIAHQVRTGRKCALKLMHVTMAQDPDAVGRFRREASSACAISHPNVATIFDSGETLDRRPYFAMEFVDGRSLSQVIRDEGPLDSWRAADIGRQIAEGLAAAHDLDIIHRDLKPENVMLGVTRGGADVVKLVDFGIAKPTNWAGSTLTRTGFILGTPAYMSPEQLCADKLDGRSDLYSLGCVLHEMLTGTTPFGGQSLEKLMMQRLTAAAPHPRTLNDQVPLVLDEIVARLLARAVDERYPDARAVADALAAAQDTMEAPRRVPGSRARSTVAAVTAPSESPREPAEVVVKVGDRPPRRSRDIVPAPPMSPSIPLRSPSLGTPRPNLEDTPPVRLLDQAGPGRATGNRWRLLVGAAAVVLLAGGAYAAWVLTRPKALAPARPVSRVAADSVHVTPQLKPDTPLATVAAKESVVAAPRRIDTTSTKSATRRAAAAEPLPAAPTVVQSPIPAPAGSLTVRTPPASVAPKETKPAEPAPLVLESKPRVDSAAIERAEVARARESVESYVNAIGAKRMDLLRQVFPAMNESSRNGYEALFSNASDLSAQLIGTPTITLRGTGADAEFAYDLRGRDPARGNFDQRMRVRAKLQKVDQRWIFVSLGAAP